MLKKTFLFAAVLALAGCAESSYVQKESPGNAYKDFKGQGTAVLGIGEPLSKRQMRANATFDINGVHGLDEIMDRFARTYNVAVRWGNGVRQNVRKEVLISELSFNEARSYVEDVYNVQIIREGERRILVLPAVDQKKITEFSPGSAVSLSEAIRGLAEQCNYNVVVTENKKEIAKTYITTSLKNINCFDAFEALLAPHGLSLVEKGDYFIIGGLPQRQWALELYEPVREEEVEVSYESAISSDDGSDSGSSENKQTIGGKATVNVTENRDLWTELEEDLIALVDKSCAFFAENSGQSGSTDDSLLLPPSTLEDGSTTDSSTVDLTGDTTSSGSGDTATNPNEQGTFECGYVRVNKSVGLVTMRAPQSVLEQADQIVRQVEEMAGRRLLVEARVLAVTRTRDFEQATDLGAGVGDSFNTINFGFQPTTSIASTINNRLRTLDDGGGLLGIRSNSLDGVVRMIETFGTTYQLMRPTIEVMDRQRATLIDGRNERFFVSEITTDTDNGVTTRSLTREERTQFVGLQFSVAAQVADKGEAHTVALQIPMTEISSFKNLTQIFEGETVTDQVPVATTRLIDQKVRIRDDEVKVIGGLTRTIAVDQESGVPLIRGIPVLGKAFDEEDISYEDVEFIVLLQVKRLY